MSQPYVSGPVHVFLVLPTGIAITGVSVLSTPRFSLSGTVTAVPTFAPLFGVTRAPFYLGTTRGKPRFRTHYEYTPYMNDKGGGKIGTGFLYQGCHGYISHDFTEWNENVYEAATSVPNALGVPGINVGGDIGTEMILEGAFTGVVWLYTFGGGVKAAMTGAPRVPGAPPSGPMPAGYFWPVCLLEEAGEDRGTEDNAVNLLYHHVRAPIALGGFVNYALGVPTGVTIAATN